MNGWSVIDRAAVATEGASGIDLACVRLLLERVTLRVSNSCVFEVFDVLVVLGLGKVVLHSN